MHVCVDTLLAKFWTPCVLHKPLDLWIVTLPSASVSVASMAAQPDDQGQYFLCVFFLPVFYACVYMYVCVLHFPLFSLDLNCHIVLSTNVLTHRYV